jgi:hypothetical protein
VPLVAETAKSTVPNVMVLAYCRLNAMSARVRAGYPPLPVLDRLSATYAMVEGLSRASARSVSEEESSYARLAKVQVVPKASQPP